MAGYQTQNLPDFSIVNVACQECSASNGVSTNVQIFYAMFEVTATGESKLYPMNFTPDMGYFQFTMPAATMTIQFNGGELVKRAIGVVSSPYLSNITYLDDKTFSFTLSGIPGSPPVNQGSLSVMIEWN